MVQRYSLVTFRDVPIGVFRQGINAIFREVLAPIRPQKAMKACMAE